MGVGSLWSTGWAAWVLAGGVCLTMSGTAIPIVLLRLLWPHLRYKGLSVALVLLGGAWAWHGALWERLEVWRGWAFSWSGIGFSAFPSGFQDDTALGKALEWRDAHNVWLEWIGRFGLPGALVLVGVVAWLWRQRWRDPWTLALVLWVACWQSLEQFPVLVMPLCVWWVGLTQRRLDAVDSLHQG